MIVADISSLCMPSIYAPKSQVDNNGLTGGRNDKKEQQQSYAAVLLSVADRIIIFAFYRIMWCAL